MGPVFREPDDGGRKNCVFLCASEDQRRPASRGIASWSATPPGHGYLTDRAQLRFRRSNSRVGGRGRRSGSVLERSREVERHATLRRSRAACPSSSWPRRPAWARSRRRQRTRRRSRPSSVPVQVTPGPRPGTYALRWAAAAPPGTSSTCRWNPRPRRPGRRSRPARLRSARPSRRQCPALIRCAPACGARRAGKPRVGRRPSR
jgi:hypothetical protein